jgi:outer membrane protein TolC
MILLFLATALAADPASPPGSPDAPAGLPSDAAENPRLTLADAMLLAVTRNPDRTSAALAEQIAAISARRARLDRATAAVSTTAGAGVDLLRPWGGPTTTTEGAPWSASVSAGLPLYAGGAIRAGIDSADAGAAIATIDRQITERTLVRAAYSAYWNIKGFEAQIAASAEALDLTQQSLDVILARANAELAAGIDVNRSKVEVLSQQNNLIAQRVALYESKQELLRLLALPGDQITLVDDPPEPATGKVTLPDNFGERRPELARRRQQAAQADAAIRQARSAILPSVGLTASAGAGSTAIAPTVAEQLRPTVSASVGVQASWNPFDLWRTPQRVAQARLGAEQVDAATESTRNQLRAEIRSAAATVDALRERAPLIAAQVGLARDNLKIVQSLYAQGSASILDLFNAQAAFRAARTQEATLRVQLATAESDLRWLLGDDLAAGDSP